MKSPRKNRIGNGHKQLTEEKIQMAKKEKTLNFTTNQRNKTVYHFKSISCVKIKTRDLLLAWVNAAVHSSSMSINVYTFLEGNVAVCHFP